MTEKDIKNKVAVVTGGSRGIGLSIVDEFLKEGAKTVVIIDINAEQGTKAITELNSKYGDGKAVFIKGDVTKDLDVIFEEIISKYKTVKVLVNNAGVVDENDIKRTININTIATVEWSMKFLEHMRIDKGGKGGIILNVSSIYGYLVDQFMMFYKASKFAVMGFTRALGHVENYKVTGVRAIVLCPGYTKTDLLDDLEPNKALSFQVRILPSLSESDLQEKEVVSKAAVDIVREAESGTAWVIKCGEKMEPLP